MCGYLVDVQPDIPGRQPLVPLGEDTGRVGGFDFAEEVVVLREDESVAPASVVCYVLVRHAGAQRVDILHSNDVSQPVQDVYRRRFDVLVGENPVAHVGLLTDLLGVRRQLLVVIEGRRPLALDCPHFEIGRAHV